LFFEKTISFRCLASSIRYRFVMPMPLLFERLFFSNELLDWVKVIHAFTTCNWRRNIYPPILAYYDRSSPASSAGEAPLTCLFLCMNAVGKHTTMLPACLSRWVEMLFEVILRGPCHCILLLGCVLAQRWQLITIITQGQYHITDLKHLYLSTLRVSYSRKKNSISARKYINCWGYLVFWFPPISLSSTRVNADARFMIWALFELLNKSANISSIKQIRWKLLLESEHKAGQLANDNQKCWRSTTLKSDFYFYFLLILLHFSGCQESQPAFPAQLFGVCRSSRTIQF